MDGGGEEKGSTVRTASRFVPRMMIRTAVSPPLGERSIVMTTPCGRTHARAHARAHTHAHTNACISRREGPCRVMLTYSEASFMDPDERT